MRHLPTCAHSLYIYLCCIILVKLLLVLYLFPYLLICLLLYFRSWLWPVGRQGLLEKWELWMAYHCTNDCRHFISWAHVHYWSWLTLGQFGLFLVNLAHLRSVWLTLGQFGSLWVRIRLLVNTGSSSLHDLQGNELMYQCKITCNHHFNENL